MGGARTALAHNRRGAVAAGAKIPHAPQVAQRDERAAAVAVTEGREGVAGAEHSEGRQRGAHRLLQLRDGGGGSDAQVRLK